MVVHPHNPCTQEAETGGSQVQSHLRLHSKTLSPKIFFKKIKQLKQAKWLVMAKTVNNLTIYQQFLKIK
jgi:hypothetical protein